MNNTLKNILLVLVVIVLALGSFAGGFVTGHFVPITSISGLQDSTAPSTASPEQQSSTPAEFQTLFAPFWEAWTLVHENYVEQPVDDLTLMRGAINGMMDTLDIGRNYYYDPKTLEEQNAALNGKDYEGIGAYVDVDADYLTVISPIRGSPAEKAGLRSGDQIIAINGEDMTGISPEDARQKVLGPGGTEVILTIFREGTDAPFDVKIIRAKIVTPLVEYEMRADGIAYVRLNTFGETADAEMRKAIEEMLAQNPKGLILDLRNNGGGYLDQGIAVSSAFMPEDQVVVLEKFGDGELKTYKSLGNGIVTDIPMVVLVNEGSASASEIVAGALQDYGRAKLVGTTTFGKGSVQSFIVLDNEQGAVGITVALWLTPKERSIDKTGLIPDIYVEFTQADLDADRDPQLDTAVETVLALLNKTPIPTSMPTTVPVP
ncbi:MAG TPA: S41 family peptidase [Anaerolineales bacterium]|nr:S41 family peptidase [Anaerolineales bacterium]